LITLQPLVAQGFLNELASQESALVGSGHAPEVSLHAFAKTKALSAKDVSGFLKSSSSFPL